MLVGKVDRDEGASIEGAAAEPIEAHWCEGGGGRDQLVGGEPALPGSNGRVRPEANPNPTGEEGLHGMENG